MSGSARVRAVVFDLDGTLVDSMPLVMRAFAHALRPARGALTEAQIFAHLGGPPERTFEAMLETEAEIAEAMRRLRDYSLENWKQIRPFDGMHAMLDGLHADERSVALWTGRDRESTGWILDENHITGKLHACVCGDDLPSHKPNPAGLAQALQMIGVEREEALFVGDADFDVMAGAAHGVNTIMITHGRAIEPQVVGQAWRVVETPAEAYAIVKSAR